MNRLFASIFVCLSIVLGNISVMSKTFKIVDHISTEHVIVEDIDHHHHNEDNNHHHRSEKKTDHQHHFDLTLVNVFLALPSLRTFSFVSLEPSTNSVSFISTTELDLRTFSSSIFRPPIA